MKKLIVLVLALVCLVGLVGCNQDKQLENTELSNEVGFVELAPNKEWLDGIGFVELAPNTEIKSSSEITISKEDAKLAYVITYGEADLTLEFGLVATDGKEYVKEIVGGHDYGFIENIPDGTYYLIVRNIVDYTTFPNRDESVSCNATGAINYRIE